MFEFLKKKKDSKDKIADLIEKKYFNPHAEKKAMERAAKESAADQNALLAKYRKQVRQKN